MRGKAARVESESHAPDANERGPFFAKRFRRLRKNGNQRPANWFVALMKAKQSKARGRGPQPVLDTGAGERMTAEQAALLRQLARDAYELEAFSTQLTQTEAAKRIAMLEAKLTLQGEPPHTL
jgi:hypothetical protein